MAKRAVHRLSDGKWRRIEPLLPKGRKGAHCVDDCRVISGIMYMLKSDARWRDCPEVYGPYTTIYNHFNRWSRQGIWTDFFYALIGSTGMYGSAPINSTYIKAHRSATGIKETFNNAIGCSRGGQTTKIHALSDEIGRSRAFLITPGNAHDLAGARGLISMVRHPRRLLAEPMMPTASITNRSRAASKP